MQGAVCKQGSGRRDSTTLNSTFLTCFIHVPPPPLCITYGLVQATVGVGTVLIWDSDVAYTTGGHTMPHPAQPQHTNYWALRTRKRHQQEHRPQRPTERSDPTQHAKGRTGDYPGPRKETTTRRNVTQGGGGG